MKKEKLKRKTIREGRFGIGRHQDGVKKEGKQERKTGEKERWKKKEGWRKRRHQKTRRRKEIEACEKNKINVENWER